MLLVAAVAKNRELRHFDVEQALLKVDNDEETYNFRGELGVPEGSGITTQDDLRTRRFRGLQEQVLQ